MNINMQGSGSALFGGGLLGGNRSLKSTQQRIERQEARDRQVAFFENQKENLKNVKCETVEEIARKLELFHSYEDQITAAKAAYNNEQIWHMMDESQEIGEKIADAVEKSKPKTPEERQEDLVEEITGAESGGIMEELDEMMDEAMELQEEMWDAQDVRAGIGPQEPVPENANAQADMQKAAEETVREKISWSGEETASASERAEELRISYRPVDFRV